MTEERQESLAGEKSIDAVLDRWMNDPTFTEQLRTDPDATLRSCGIDPDDETLARFKSLDYDAPIEELQARVSKWGAYA